MSANVIGCVPAAMASAYARIIQALWAAMLRSRIFTNPAQMEAVIAAATAMRMIATDVPVPKTGG